MKKINTEILFFPSNNIKKTTNKSQLLNKRHTNSFRVTIKTICIIKMKKGKLLVIFFVSYVTLQHHPTKTCRWNRRVGSTNAIMTIWRRSFLLNTLFLKYIPGTCFEFFHGSTACFKVWVLTRKKSHVNYHIHWIWFLDLLTHYFFFSFSLDIHLNFVIVLYTFSEE